MEQRFVVGVEDYLESLRVGRHEGQGEFAVSAAEYLEKFGSVMALKEGWIVKIFQALAYWQAKTVQVMVGRREFLIRAEGLAVDKALNKSSLFSHPLDWRGHHHLLIGLLSLQKMADTDHCLVTWVQNGTVHELRISDDDFESTECDAENSDGLFSLRLRRRISPTLLGRLFWRSDFSEATELLKQRSPFYPVGIALDSLPLGDARELVGISRALTDKLGLLRREKTFGQRRNTGLLGMDVLYQIGGSGPAAGLGSGHYFAWVQDGMISDYQSEAPRESVVSLTTYLDGEGLPTDLSSLKLREGLEKQVRLRQAKQGFPWRVLQLEELARAVEEGMPPKPGAWKEQVREISLLAAMLQSHDLSDQSERRQREVQEYGMYAHLLELLQGLAQRVEKRLG